MSRAPKNEHSIPLHAAVNPYGIIDFADGHLGAQAPPGAIVGGPPAFLEAHGIRYVPVTALGAEDAPEPEIAPRADARLVPMDRAEGHALSEAVPCITRRELDARVEEGIRRFLQRDTAASTSSRIQSMRSELMLGSGAEDVEWAERGRRTSKRLEALRAEAEAASTRMRAEARPSSTARKIEALRAEVEASAKRAPRAKARPEFDF